MPPFPCCVTVRGARNTAAIFERFAVSAAIVYTGNGRIGHFFTIEATEDELGTNVTIHDMFDEQRGRPSRTAQCASLVEFVRGEPTVSFDVLLVKGR